MEVVPARGRQVLNPVTEFLGTKSGARAIPGDVSMKDVLLTTAAIIDIQCADHHDVLPAVVRRNMFLFEEQVPAALFLF